MKLYDMFKVVVREYPRLFNGYFFNTTDELIITPHPILDDHANYSHMSRSDEVKYRFTEAVLQTLVGLPKFVELMDKIDEVGIQSNDGYWAMVLSSVAKSAFNIVEFDHDYNPFNAPCPNSIGLREMVMSYVNQGGASMSSLAGENNQYQAAPEDISINTEQIDENA